MHSYVEACFFHALARPFKHSRTDEITFYSKLYMIATVVPTKSDSGVILCLQLLSKTLH